jgi:hypothetical protein
MREMRIRFVYHYSNNFCLNILKKFFDYRHINLSLKLVTQDWSTGYAVLLSNVFSRLKYLLETSIGLFCRIVNDGRINGL